MDNKTLTQEQVKGILDNAPGNLDKKMILQRLVEQGYQLEGFNTTPVSTTTSPSSPTTSEGFLDKSAVEQIFSKEFLQAVPKAAYETLAGNALKFIKSAVEVPQNIVQSVQGKPITTTEGKDPVTGEPITSFQSDFQNKTIPAVESGEMTPLGATVRTVGGVVLGGADVLGAEALAKGAIKGASAVGQGIKNASSGIKTLATDVSNSIEKTGSNLVTGTSRAGSIAGETVLGTQGQEAAIQAYKNPELVSDFINKRKTLETVVQQAKSGVTKIENKSLSELQKIKDSVPDIKIPRETYINTFKQKISDFLGITTEQSAKLTDKTIPEYLSQTGLGAPEQQTVSSLIKKITNWKDTSLKGLLDLKASIDKTGFYKGLQDSPNADRFVQIVRNHINDLITKKEFGGYAKLAPALKKSSDTITFLDTLKSNILGKGGVNIESAANKLNALMTKLADPLQREATINLLERFKKETGIDLVNILNSARAAKLIEAPLAGFKNPLRTLQGLADRGAGRAAIQLGKRAKK